MNYHILSTAQRYNTLTEGATCDDITPNAGDIQSSMCKTYFGMYNSIHHHLHTVYVYTYIYALSLFFHNIYNVVLAMIYKKVLLQYYVNKIKTKDFDLY